MVLQASHWFGEFFPFVNILWKKLIQVCYFRLFGLDIISWYWWCCITCKFISITCCFVHRYSDLTWNRVMSLRLPDICRCPIYNRFLTISGLTLLCTSLLHTTRPAMAWRSSGTDNENLVDNLQSKYIIISSISTDLKL